MDYFSSIFEYITTQESLYEKSIAVNKVWHWSMKDHILTTDLYTNSQLLNGKTDFTPIKNITRPILNLEHRTEAIEVKDVQIYVDEPSQFHLSFLVKRYHDDVFVVENDLDTFFDDLNISRIDYGGGLSKKMLGPCPEVVPMQSIAFCDQTDILSGPLGLKHYYSPDQLLKMAKFGWGDEKNGATVSIPDLISLSRSEKKGDSASTNVKTPGRYIEVYEVHGNLPKIFADVNDSSGEYETRIYICAFYQLKNSDRKQGVILYTAPEKESPFKLIKRDAVHGRGLGFGGAEELFEAQVWTNYDMIRVNDMLDGASKTILKTTDPMVASRNKIRDMDNLEIIELAMGTDLSQVDTFPRNLQIFERSIAEWENHAQQMAAANEAIQGENPAAGTPFKLQQLVTTEAHGLHDYRKGQYAKHIESIYRDWIIPHIEREICKGTQFLSQLSLEELQYVVDALVNNQVEAAKKEYVLSNGGLAMTPEMEQQLVVGIQTKLKRQGSKYFIQILKGEFSGMSLAVKVDVAGKQKDLSGMVDKLTNVFKTVIANPYILQSPPIAAMFNKIIEAAGLDPIDLSNFKVPPLPTRRMTSTIDYADLATPPNAEQEAMLELSGITPPAPTSPMPTNRSQPLAPLDH